MVSGATPGGGQLLVRTIRALFVGHGVTPPGHCVRRPLMGRKASAHVKEHPSRFGGLITPKHVLNCRKKHAEMWMGLEKL